MQKQVDDTVRPCHVRKLHTYQCDHHTDSHIVCNMAVGNAVEFEVVRRLKLPYSSYVVLQLFCPSFFRTKHSKSTNKIPRPYAMSVIDWLAFH